MPLRELLARMTSDELLEAHVLHLTGILPPGAVAHDVLAASQTAHAYLIAAPKQKTVDMTKLRRFGTKPPKRERDPRELFFGLAKALGAKEAT